VHVFKIMPLHGVIICAHLGVDVERQQ